MKIDAELNSETSSAAGEPDAQTHGKSPAATAPESEAAMPAAATSEGSSAGAAEDGQGKAVMTRVVEPSVEKGKSSAAAETAPSEAAAVDPLGEALAALDRRDYATAQRLFEALGRKDAAAAIANALAALDRKDYATAQGLFEALGKTGPGGALASGWGPAAAATAKPAASMLGPISFGSRGKAQQKPVTTPPEVIPLPDAAYRQSLPQAKKAKARGLKTLFLRTGLVLFAACAAFEMYVSPLNGTVAATKNQVMTSLASTVGLLEQPLEAIARPWRRDEERAALRDVSAALTQVTIRLDQIEQEHGARLDKLGERIDQESSTKSADIATRLDRLEKKAAVATVPASEFSDVAARLDRLEKRVTVAAAPASEFADITARLNKLEKRAEAAAAPSPEGADSGAKLDKADKRGALAASSAKPLPPAKPKQSTLLATAEPSPSDEIAAPAKPKPLLRNYSVEEVRNGVAVVDSRYGPQEVAPGDIIPGAGRVLRIERRGGDWVVLTSVGVIARGPGPY